MAIDNVGKLKEEKLQLEAKEIADDFYEVELPSNVNTKEVNKIEKVDLVNSNNETIEVEVKDNKIQLSKEQLENYEINLKVDYNKVTKEIQKDGRNETIELYNKTLKNDKNKAVELKGNLPEDAELVVEETAKDRVEKIFGDIKIDVAYNIEITNQENTEINPQDFEEVCVVSIADSRIAKNSIVYHVKEDDTFEQVNVIESIDGKVTFEAKAFSDYAVSGTSGTDIILNTMAVDDDITPPIAGTMTMKLNDASGAGYNNNTWTNQNVYIAVNNGSDLGGSGHASTTYTVLKGGTTYLSNQTSEKILTDEGTYTITVTTKDGAGNTATNTYTVKIDKTNPTVGTLIMKLNSSTGDNYTSDTWTNQSVYIAVNNGTDAGGSEHQSTTYTVLKDGAEYSTNQTSETLTDEGTYTITVTTTDGAGNTATSGEYKVKIDKTAPTVGNLTMKTPDENGEDYISGDIAYENVYLAVSNGSDALSGHQLTTYTILKDENAYLGNQTNPQTISEDGTYTITVKTTDVAGNMTISNSYIVSKGTLPTEVTQIVLENGTINPIYRPRWSHSSTIDTVNKKLTITLKTSAYLNQVIENSDVTINYASDVTSTLENEDIQVFVNDVEVTSITHPTRVLSSGTESTNETSGKKEISHTFELSNLEEAARQAGIPYKELSGNIKLKIKGRGKDVSSYFEDVTTDEYGNQNMMETDQNGTNADGTWIAITFEDPEADQNTDGTMFADFIKPEFTYEYSVTDINYSAKTVTIVFSVVDKYFNSSNLTAEQLTVWIDGKIPGDTNKNGVIDVTETYSITRTLTIKTLDTNEINATTGEIYKTDGSIEYNGAIIGKRYELVLEDLEQKDENGYPDGFNFSGTVSVLIPAGTVDESGNLVNGVIDNSGNLNDAMTINVGVDEPEDSGNEEIADVVDPAWKMENIDIQTNGVTFDLIATDKYYASNNFTEGMASNLIANDKMKIYVDGILDGDANGNGQLDEGETPTIVKTLTATQYQQYDGESTYTTATESTANAVRYKITLTNWNAEIHSGSTKILIPEETITDQYGNKSEDQEFFIGHIDYVKPVIEKVSSTNGPDGKTQTIVFTAKDKYIDTSDMVTIPDETNPDADDEITVYIDDEIATGITRTLTITSKLVRNKATGEVTNKALDYAVGDTEAVMGYEYTLVLSDLEQARTEINRDREFTDWSGTVEIEIAEGAVKDIQVTNPNGDNAGGNRNDATTLVGNFVDYIKPNVTYEFLETDIVQNHADKTQRKYSMVFDITDKYFTESAFANALSVEGITEEQKLEVLQEYLSIFVDTEDITEIDTVTKKIVSVENVEATMNKTIFNNDGTSQIVTGGTYVIGKRFTLEISNLEQLAETAMEKDYLDYSGVITVRIKEGSATDYSSNVNKPTTITSGIDMMGNDPNRGYASPSALLSSGALQIGDFVEYDAGTWTADEINAIKVGPKDALVTANGSTSLPTESFQFGGFTSGMSRNESATESEKDHIKEYTSDGSTVDIKGWRVFDIDDDGTVTLISAGAAEGYYLSSDVTNSAYISEHILTGSSNYVSEEEASNYTTRNWSDYINLRQKAESVTVLTLEQLNSWYSKYITANANVYSDTFKLIYEEPYIKYQNIIDINTSYRLGSAWGSEQLYCVRGWTRVVTIAGNGASPLRVLVTLSPDVLFSAEKTGTKTLTGGNMNTYGGNQTYNVWEIQTDESEVVDLVDPQWQLAAKAEARAHDRYAKLTIKGIDKYIVTDDLIPSDIAITVTSPAGTLKLEGTASGSKKIYTTEDINGNGTLDEGEDINGNGTIDSGANIQVRGDINGNGIIDSGEQGIMINITEDTSVTLDYGKQYKVEVIGFTTDAYQVKLTLRDGILEDESGNTSQEASFVLFSSLVETSTEAEQTSEFLSKNKQVGQTIPQRQYVEQVIIKDNLTGMNDTQWDVSQLNDGTIWAWYTTRTASDGTTLYTVYIGSYVIINANVNSSYLFANIGYNSNCKVTGDTTDNELIENLDFIHTASATNMSHMFEGCGYANMQSFDLGSNFDTRLVTTMSGMFKDCGYTSMKTLNIGQKFDTSKVTYMNSMFNNCGQNAMTTFSVGSSTNTADFDTTNVENMNAMFQNFGHVLGSLTLGSKFITNNVTDMSDMFNGTGKTSMATLNLGNNFNTAKVKKMNSMFKDFATNSTTMKVLDLEDLFYTIDVNDMNYMFNGCGSSSMEILDLGPAFTKIAETNADFIKSAGKKGVLTIYAPEAIFKDIKTFKLNSNSNTTISLDITDDTTTPVTYRGTINPIYKPEWEKVSSTLDETNKKLQVVVKGVANKTFTNGTYTGTYLSDVVSSLTKNDVIVYLDGELAEGIDASDITVSEATISTNETTNKTEVQYTITISNFEQAIRLAGKNFKEWSGNVELQFAKSSLIDSWGSYIGEDADGNAIPVVNVSKDADGNIVGNSSLAVIDIDTAGTMEPIVVEEATKQTANAESGDANMFADFIKPEFTYEYANTVIDYAKDKKSVTVVFDVTDKYFNSTDLASDNNGELIEVLVDGVLPGDENGNGTIDGEETLAITKTLVKSGIFVMNTETNEISSKATDYTLQANERKVGERYQLVISNLQQDPNDSFDFSGIVTLGFDSGIVTDLSGNENDATTITIGVDEPELQYKSPSDLFDSTGEIENALHIGDFVNYDAGTWTQAEIDAIQVGPKDNLVTANGSTSTPNTAFQFGGFEAGGSRNGIETTGVKDSSTGKPLTGWRIFDINDDGTVTLISAGNPEKYYNASSVSRYINEYILTGNVNSKWTDADISLYQRRDWNDYVNVAQKAESAIVLTKNELDRWYSKNIGADEGASIKDDEIFQRIYADPYLSYQNVVDINNRYWIYDSGDYGMMFLNSEERGLRSLSNQGYGVRILVTLSPDVLFNENRIGTKTLTGGNMDTYGGNQTYNVWGIQQEGVDVDVVDPIWRVQNLSTTTVDGTTTATMDLIATDKFFKETNLELNDIQLNIAGVNIAEVDAEGNQIIAPELQRTLSEPVYILWDNETGTYTTDGVTAENANGQKYTFTISNLEETYEAFIAERAKYNADDTTGRLYREYSGPVEIVIPAGTIIDESNNENIEFTVDGIGHLDTLKPEVVKVSSQANINATNSELSTHTIVFDIVDKYINSTSITTTDTSKIHVYFDDEEAPSMTKPATEEEQNANRDKVFKEITNIENLTAKVNGTTKTIGYRYTLVLSGIENPRTSINYDREYTDWSGDVSIKIDANTAKDTTNNGNDATILYGNEGETKDKTKADHVDYVKPDATYEYDSVQDGVSDVTDKDGKTYTMVFDVTDKFFLTEDINANGQLDEGEDTNSNGILDDGDTLSIGDFSILMSAEEETGEGKDGYYDLMANALIEKALESADITNEVVVDVVDGTQVKETRVIGKRYTLKLSNLEQLQRIENNHYLDYSGSITITIPANKIVDTSENGNDVTTITTGIDIPGGEVVDIEAVDVVQPLWERTSFTTDIHNKTATITLLGTDKYFYEYNVDPTDPTYNADEANKGTLTLEEIGLYINGIATTGTISEGVKTLTDADGNIIGKLSIASETKLDEERLVQNEYSDGDVDTGYSTETVQYGVQYVLNLTDLAVTANQIKIHLPEGSLVDQSANPNRVTEFLVYNTLKTATNTNGDWESDPTSGFLGNASIQRQNIEKVEFVDSLDAAPTIGTESAEGVILCWDVSAQRDNSILAWATQTATQATNGLYTVYIGSNDDIYGNIDSSYLFAWIGANENEGVTITATDTISGINLLDTRNVTNMSYMFAFTGAIAMTDLNLGENFDTSNVTDMTNMFWLTGAMSMTNLNLGEKFDTSNVTNMSSMFYATGGMALTSLDLGDNFDTSNVENMSSMFEQFAILSTGFSTLDLSATGVTFNTEKVTDMRNMFKECGQAGLTTFNLGSNFNTSSVQDMSGMFQDFAYNLEILNLGSNFHTTAVTNMINMFNGCGQTSMTTLNLGDNFDTSAVQYIDGMFQDLAKSSTTMTSLDLGDKFYTTAATGMDNMFNGCGQTAMTTLDLGPAFTKIPTSNTTNFVTNTGKSGACVIYAPESIYKDMTHFKLNTDSTTKIEYTRGTINPIYKPEWSKVSSTLDTSTGIMTVVVKGTANKTFTNGSYTGTYVSDVASILPVPTGTPVTPITLTGAQADLIKVYIDDELSKLDTDGDGTLDTETITKTITSAVTSTNATTGATEVTYTITLDFDEDEIRRSGKNFLEWSGNVELQFAKGSLRDKYGSYTTTQTETDAEGNTVEVIVPVTNVFTDASGNYIGNSSLAEIDVDTAGTMEKIVVADANSPLTENSETPETEANMFSDTIEPEFTYEFANTVIGSGPEGDKKVKVVFDVTDKYFNSTDLATDSNAELITILVDGKLPGDKDGNGSINGTETLAITKTLTKTAIFVMNKETKAITMQNTDYEVQSTEQKVGERYELLIEDIQQNPNDSSHFSGIFTLSFGAGIVDDLSENENNATVITIGVDKPAAQYNSPSELLSSGNLQIGDFVDYDAGTWTQEEIDAIKVGSVDSLVSANGSTDVPNTAYQFGGFTAGSSRNGNVTPYDTTQYIKDSSTNEAITGWRIFDINEDGTVVLISAGSPEQYSMGEMTANAGYISEYILTGNKNHYWSVDDITAYQKRNWNNYINVKQKAESATVLTKSKLDSWYSKYIVTNADTDTFETFRMIYEEPYLKLQNVIDNYTYYWLGDAPYGSSLFYFWCNARRLNYGSSGCNDVRVLVSLSPDVLFESESIGTKTLTGGNMDTYGGNQTYNIWSIKTQEQESGEIVDVVDPIWTGPIDVNTIDRTDDKVNITIIGSDKFYASNRLSEEGIEDEINVYVDDTLQTTISKELTQITDAEQLTTLATNAGLPDDVQLIGYILTLSNFGDSAETGISGVTKIQLPDGTIIDTSGNINKNTPSIFAGNDVWEEANEPLESGDEGYPRYPAFRNDIVDFIDPVIKYTYSTVMVDTDGDGTADSAVSANPDIDYDEKEVTVKFTVTDKYFLASDLIKTTTDAEGNEIQIPNNINILVDGEKIYDSSLETQTTQVTTSISATDIEGGKEYTLVVSNIQQHYDELTNTTPENGNGFDFSGPMQLVFAEGAIEDTSGNTNPTTAISLDTHVDGDLVDVVDPIIKYESSSINRTYNTVSVTLRAEDKYYKAETLSTAEDRVKVKVVDEKGDVVVNDTTTITKDITKINTQSQYVIFTVELSNFTIYEGKTSIIIPAGVIKDSSGNGNVETEILVGKPDDMTAFKDSIVDFTKPTWEYVTSSINRDVDANGVRTETGTVTLVVKGTDIYFDKEKYLDDPTYQLDLNQVKVYVNGVENTSITKAFATNEDGTIKKEYIEETKEIVTGHERTLKGVKYTLILGNFEANEGTVRVDIPTNAIKDTSGNGNILTPIDVGNPEWIETVGLGAETEDVDNPIYTAFRNDIVDYIKPVIEYQYEENVNPVLDRSADAETVQIKFTSTDTNYLSLDAKPTNMITLEDIKIYIDNMQVYGTGANEATDITADLDYEIIEGTPSGIEYTLTLSALELNALLENEIFERHSGVIKLVIASDQVADTSGNKNIETTLIIDNDDGDDEANGIIVDFINPIIYYHDKYVNWEDRYALITLRATDRFYDTTTKLDPSDIKLYEKNADGNYIEITSITQDDITIIPVANDYGYDFVIRIDNFEEEFEMKISIPANQIADTSNNWNDATEIPVSLDNKKPVWNYVSTDTSNFESSGTISFTVKGEDKFLNLTNSNLDVADIKVLKDGVDITNADNITVNYLGTNTAEEADEDIYKKYKIDVTGLTEMGTYSLVFAKDTLVDDYGNKSAATTISFSNAVIASNTGNYVNVTYHVSQDLETVHKSYVHELMSVNTTGTNFENTTYRPSSLGELFNNGENPLFAEPVYVPQVSGYTVSKEYSPKSFAGWAEADENGNVIYYTDATLTTVSQVETSYTRVFGLYDEIPNTVVHLKALWQDAKIVYVSATNGDNTNNGQLPDTPVKDLQTAYTLLDTNGDGTPDGTAETNIIIIMDVVESSIDYLLLNGSATITSIYGGIDYRTQGAELILASDSDESYQLIMVNGDIIFDNIELASIGMSYLVSNYSGDIILGRGITTAEDNYTLGIVVGGDFATETSTGELGTHTIRVESGKYNGVVAGSILESSTETTKAVTHNVIIGNMRDASISRNDKLSIEQFIIGGFEQKCYPSGATTANQAADKVYANVTMYSGTIGAEGVENSETIYLRSGKGETDGLMNFEMYGGQVIGNIYGGSRISTLYATSVYNSMKFYGGQVTGNIYGQGMDQTFFGSSEITLQGNFSITGNVYGGPNMTSATNSNLGEGNSTIIVNSGSTTINGNIYGGGRIAEASTGYVTGNTNITINSGTVQNIYGSGFNCGNTGTSNIIIENGVVNQNIYGGAYQNQVRASSNISVLGGTVHGNIYGGNENTLQEAHDNDSYSQDVNIIIGDTDATKKPTVKGTIYGSGKYDKVDAVTIELYENEDIISVFGGSDEIATTATTNIYLKGMTVNEIYGGSHSKGTVGTSNIYLQSGTVTDVYGGGYGTDVTTKANVTLEGTATATTIYGGSNTAGTVTTSSVVLKSGNITNVFGGGNSAGVGTANVTLDGVTLNTIHGGSKDAGLVTKSNVTLISGTVTNVFGGGLDVGATTSNIKQQGATVTNIYGGNNTAGTESATGGETGTANIDIQNSTVANVYGGNYLKGTTNTVKINIHGTSTVTGNVFGGGYKTNIGKTDETGSVTINIAGGIINGDINGGSEEGIVYGNVNIFVGNEAIQSSVLTPKPINIIGTIYGAGSTLTAGENTVVGYTNITMDNNTSYPITYFTASGKEKSIYGSGKGGAKYLGTTTDVYGNVQDKSTIHLLDFGTSTNPYLFKSIEDTGDLYIGNSIIELSGALENITDAVGHYYTLNTITNALTIYNNTTLYTQRGFKQVGGFYSYVNQKSTKATVTISDGVATTNVNNKLYTLEGVNLIFAKKNVTLANKATLTLDDWGEVTGMAYFGTYKNTLTGKQYDLDLFRAGTYVEGLYHSSTHNIERDGFYTTVENPTSGAEEAQIITTVNYTNYCDWIINAPTINYEVDLVASTYGQNSVAELLLDYVYATDYAYKAETIYTLNQVSSNALKPGIELVDPSDPTKIPTISENANNKFGLTMETTETGWQQQALTKIYSADNGSFGGDSVYRSDAQNTPGSIKFKVHNSLNITEEKDLGLVTIKLVGQQPISAEGAEAYTFNVVIAVNLQTIAVEFSDDYVPSFTDRPETELSYTTDSRVDLSYTLFNIKETTPYETGDYRVISTTVPLPKGTKLTMRDYGEGNNVNKVYYYQVASNTDYDSTESVDGTTRYIYKLSKFTEMGSTNDSYVDTSNYYHSADEYVLEKYDISIDFIDADVDNNVSADILALAQETYIELRDASGNVKFDNGDTIIKYNLCSGKNAIATTTISNEGSLYSVVESIEVPIDISASLLQQPGVLDTKYYDQIAGIAVQIVGENNMRIKNPEIQNFKLTNTATGEVHVADSNGTIRVPIIAGLGSKSSSYTLSMTQVNVSPGVYRAQVFLYTADDGLYYGDTAETEPVEFKVTFINRLAGLLGAEAKDLNELTRIINKTTGLSLVEGSTTANALDLVLGINNPTNETNIRVELYKRNATYTNLADETSYTGTSYTLVDIKNYLQGTWTETVAGSKEYMVSDKKTYETAVQLETIDFKKSIIQGISTGEYKLVFKAYSDDTLVQTFSKTFIVTNN